MDNQRVLLYAAFGFLLLLLWQQWQLDYNTPKPPAAVASSTSQSGASSDDSPTIEGANPLAPADATDIPGSSAAVNDGQSIHVVTDVLDITIGTKGGDIREAKLLAYPVSIEQPDNPFRLLSANDDKFYVAQSGLQAKNKLGPTHHDQYLIEKSEYALGDNEKLIVPLKWTSDQGVTVTKYFTFTKGSYLVDVSFKVENGTSETWSATHYRQLQQRPTGEGASIFAGASYNGGVISSAEEPYTKITFEDMSESNLNEKIQGGWAAMIEHYFLSAWVPAADEQNTYYSKALKGNGRYILGLYAAPQSVEAGQTGTFSSKLYIGPKIQDDLAEIANNLDLTIDYGILTILAAPLFWLLKNIHSIIGNWGWAIIIVTIIIKAVFYKLSETSYRSMARMRKLQPKLQSLKERFGDDRQKMGQATMDLYKKEKVNPLGGCLPILVQIPVFISLYWVLLESVELRQSPWILWIEDLAIKDPFFILPLIMGVTMFIQQKLNPAPVDPIQAKVFLMMPIVFTFFFAFFPAGLVLYWVVNNTLSITQQYYITRHVLAEK